MAGRLCEARQFNWLPCIEYSHPEPFTPPLLIKPPQLAEPYSYVCSNLSSKYFPELIAGHNFSSSLAYVPGSASIVVLKSGLQKYLSHH